MKVAAPDAPLSLSGTVDSLNADITAQLNSIPASLSGPVSLLVRDGAIDDINLLGQTLGNIGSIPGVDFAIADAIPEEYQTVLEGDKTAFDTLTVQLRFGQNGFQLTSADLKHSLYIVRGAGTMSFGGSLAIRAELAVTPLLAQKMVLRQPKIKLLLDKDNNLVIPIVIKKKGSSFIVIPDAEKLLKSAARNTAKEAAGRALDKVAPGLGEASKVLDSLF